MANKRVLVTSKGCYAVSDKGVTIELKAGEEASIEDAQAAVFVKVGKAKLIINKKKAVKKAADEDLDTDEGSQDDEPLGDLEPETV